MAEVGFSFEAVPCDSFGELCLGFCVEEVADVPEFACLVFGGLDQLRVAVAEYVGAEAREEIEVVLAV